MKDTGSLLESKFQSWLKEITCYSYKPVDFKSLMFLIANFPQIKDRIPKAPCDRIVIYKGRSFFFELKHTLGKSIAFDRIKNHQMGGMLKHADKGKGKSYFILGYKCKLDKKSPVTLHIYAISAQFIAKIITESQIRKSISIDSCIKHGFLLKNIDDLEDFLKFIYK